MSDNDLCETPQATQQSVLNRTGKDKFILVLNLPLVMRRKGIIDKLINIDPIQISIHGTTVPQISIPPTEIRFLGQSVNVSSHSRPNYGPLPVNFMVDNKFHNYWVLWKWLSILNEPVESGYSGTPLSLENFKDQAESGIENEYQTTFSVLGLNEYNEPSIEFIYKYAFITGLGPINYSYRDPEIIEASAEFQFSQLDIKLFE